VLSDEGDSLALQLVQELDPGEETPPWQSRHAELPLGPAAGWYLPAAQSRHAVPSVYFPGSQSVHDSDPIGLAFPAEHSSQDVAPLELKRPAPHEPHAAAPPTAENLPGEQFWHDDAPEAAYLPGLHVEQLELEEEPGGLLLPSTHAAHDVEATSTEYLPL
jgi:hypothetical protein